MSAPVIDMQSFATRERSVEDDIRKMPNRGRSPALNVRTDLKFLKGRVKDMTDEYAEWKTHHRDIADFIMPRRSDFLKGKRARGGKKNENIINSRATKAVRRAVAGFQSGMTPRTRPWFLFEPDLEDPEQGRFATQGWADEARRIVFSVLQRSNFYTSSQTCYQDFVPFGIGCVQIDEDPGPKVIRTRVHPIGSYVIDTNEEGEIDTWSRTYRWTLKKIIAKFGRNNLPRKMQQAAKKQIGEKYDVTNIILPNEDYEFGALGVKGKPFTSVWWVDGFEETDGPLRVAGYNEFPIFCPRTWKVGDEPWPQAMGMDALPDVKQLQLETKLKLEGLEKQVWPPMKGPASVAQQGPSQLPGSYEGVSNGAETLTPQYEVRFDLSAVYEDIAILEQSIAETFFEPIFTAIMDTAQRQRTLGEVEKIEAEKFMMLGPILENLIDDFLEPAIVRVYSICERRRMIPELPSELEGQNINVAFVSILAQAQKALEAVGVEQTVGFAASLAELWPRAASRIDIDDALERYSEAVGGQEVLRTREESDKMDAAADKAAQQQVQLDQAQQAASAARDASQIPPEAQPTLVQAAQAFAGGAA